MTTDNVRRVVRASAAYDLLVTAAFALPWTAALALGQISTVHGGLGLRGTLPQVEDPFTILLANLLGSIVVVWSVVRLLRPTPFHGAADTVARFLFSAWFAWALAQGASPVLVAFLIPEIAWGVVQGAAVWKPVATEFRTRERRTLAAC